MLLLCWWWLCSVSVACSIPPLVLAVWGSYCVCYISCANCQCCVLYHMVVPSGIVLGGDFTKGDGTGGECGAGGLVHAHLLPSTFLVIRLVFMLTVHHLGCVPSCPKGVGHREVSLYTICCGDFPATYSHPWSQATRQNHPNAHTALTAVKAWTVNLTVWSFFKIKWQNNSTTLQYYHWL